MGKSLTKIAHSVAILVNVYNKPDSATARMKRRKPGSLFLQIRYMMTARAKVSTGITVKNGGRTSCIYVDEDGTGQNALLHSLIRRSLHISDAGGTPICDHDNAREVVQ